MNDAERRIADLRQENTELEGRIASLERTGAFNNAILDAESPAQLVTTLENIFSEVDQTVSSVGVLRSIHGTIPGFDASLLQLLGATGLYAQFTGNVFHMGGTLSGSAFLTRTAQYAPEARKHPGTFIPEGVNGEASELAVPIMSGASNILSSKGVLFLRRETTDSFSYGSRRSLASLAQNIGRTVREKITHFESQYDSGCPTFFNKGAGYVALQNAYDFCTERRLPFTLAFLDANDFKKTNDTYGHLVVDRALLTTTLALTQHLRHGDVPVRYGGDEFVIGFVNVVPEDVEGKLRDMLNSVAVPSRSDLYESYLASRGLELPGEMNLPFSAGVVGVDVRRMHSVHDRLHLPHLQELLDRADKALYEAKKTKTAGASTVFISH